MRYLHQLDCSMICFIILNMYVEKNILRYYRGNGVEYKYKYKETVISYFNEGQTHYKNYENLFECNLEEAQKELNIAGAKLQQSYELGLKCYLNRRYKQKYDCGDIKWKICKKLQAYIESGRDANGRMVDIRYLMNEMIKYADPDINNTDINFDIIRRNNKLIYNENKHIGNDVKAEYFKESYNEIRKFILNYIDPNPPINVIQSAAYVDLQDACDFWADDTRYNYCLICDKLEDLDDCARRKLLYIKWALVIDFDVDSQINGLYRSYINEYDVQPNVFDVLNPKNTQFYNATDAPYWFHMNGLSDISESIVDSDRMWNRKYGATLQTALCKYRSSFSKPLKIIIVNGPAMRISKIISELDSIYADELKIYLLSNEVQFESITAIYEDAIQKFPMSAYELTQGIGNFASLFKKEQILGDIQVPGIDGKVGIKLEDYSSFEIPYLGIAEDENLEKDMDNVLFYQAERPLSWYGAKNGFAIDRLKQYRKYRDEIIEGGRVTTSKIIRLCHDPGAGGTTFSRCLAYNLSKEMPVLILNNYNERLTPRQTINFYRKVGMSILIVAESSLISGDELQRFNGELMSNAVAHVFLYVSRSKGKGDNSNNSLRYLNDVEFMDMYGKLKPYLDSKTDVGLQSLKRNMKDRYPFFMSMYAFDDKFVGVKKYVEQFINDSTENDVKKLEYISLVDWFANRTVDISFLNSFNGPDCLFENMINENLVTLENKGRNTFIKMRHPRFAETILEHRIGGSDDGNSLEKANRLSSLLREFIRYSKMNVMYDLDSTIDVLKNLLILRDTESMVKSKFAPVIEYMNGLIPSSVDDNAKYNCIGLVFKELVDVYPEETHFRAHLSRYYSRIEKNYEKGIDEAKKAVDLAEQSGEYDVLLYHIYGMSIRWYVEQKLFIEALDYNKYGENDRLNEKLIDIEEELKLASEQFSKVRDTNNKVAGYISDIEMCIAVVDFGKSLYGKTTEEFVVEYKDSWMMEYYDRALTLLEGFRTIQVEEDTEFYKVVLQVRCENSLQDMIRNIESTLNMWQTYLERAEDSKKPIIRRFIARAKQQKYKDNNDQGEIKEILNLMEKNMSQEPNNESNIRIWFNALRRLKSENEDILLDDALQKLATRKQIGGNLQAYYYYFVLMCIKAIEGSSRAEAVLPELSEELSAKTAHMPNNRVIYEWLGSGKGIGRLISAYELGEKHNYRRKSIDQIEKEACYLDGRIISYKSARSAQIRAYNMDIFFSPTGQNIQATPEDINKRVSFILGFSYDGLRALNRSIQLIGAEEVEEEAMIGKTVRCSVTGIDSNSNYVKVKMLDYRNCQGSIHKSKLPEGESVYDYETGKLIYAEIIDEHHDNQGRKRYSLSLAKRELDEWQKKLSIITSR